MPSTCGSRRWNSSKTADGARAQSRCRCRARRARPLAGRLRAAADPDPWLALLTHELGSVVEQVLHQLDQPLRVTVHDRQRTLDLDTNAAGAQASVDERRGLAHDVEKGHVDVRPGDATGARQLEQVLEQAAHAVGGRADPGDVGLQPFRVALARVALQVAQEPPDRDERALQIVGDHVREALELRAAGLQLAIGVGQASAPGLRLDHAAHDVGDQQVYRHGGHHEHDRHVDDRHPAEATSVGRPQDARVLQPDDHRHGQRAERRRRHQQPQVEQQGRDQDDHRIDEHGAVMDPLTADEQDHVHRGDHAPERQHPGRLRLATPQQPEREREQRCRGRRAAARRRGCRPGRSRRRPRPRPRNPRAAADAGCWRRGPAPRCRPPAEPRHAAVAPRDPRNAPSPAAPGYVASTARAS